MQYICETRTYLIFSLVAQIYRFTMVYIKRAKRVEYCTLHVVLSRSVVPHLTGRMYCKQGMGWGSSLHDCKAPAPPDSVQDGAALTLQDTKLQSLYTYISS